MSVAQPDVRARLGHAALARWQAVAEPASRHRPQSRPGGLRAGAAAPGEDGSRSTASIAQRVETLASELERTEFELPDGMTDLRFWPLGIGGRSRDPLAEAGDRLLVVSPFVTLGRLEELADGRKDVTVVSTSNALGMPGAAAEGHQRSSTA